MIKEYTEVEDLEEYVKEKSKNEELDQQMTERPLRKEYSLMSREKQ